jgi:hypothetical protein
LVAEGVRFAVATDHNQVTDYAPVIDQLDVERELASVTGIEITTKVWGHFNAYPFPVAEPPPPYADIAPVALFEHVRKVAPGALIQVNHPRMDAIGYFNRAGLDASTGTTKEADASLDFDAIEIFNGFDLNSVPRVEGILREWFQLLNLGRRPTAVGSSDSHKVAFQWAGYPRTYARVAEGEQANQGAILASIRAGRAFVTNGPFVLVRLGGVEPGDTLSASPGRVPLEVDVLGPPWLEVDKVRAVISGSEVALEPAPAEGMLWRHRGELVIDRDAWVVVVAKGSKSLEDILPGAGAFPLAFTNPVWVDSDGDGLITLPSPGGEGGAGGAGR